MKMKLKLTLALVCLAVLALCFVACGQKDPPASTTNNPDVSPSHGFDYTSSDDGTYYIVSGIGTCTDTDIVIPEAYEGKPVKAIGEYAFADNNITSVTIPNNVTSIGDYAFEDCSALTSVTLGNGVASIGSYAFRSCFALQNIIVAEDNTTYKSIDGNLYTKDGKTLVQYAIDKPETSFTIPDGVTSIGDDAFAYCATLTFVDIPDSVTNIGERAFGGCTALASVVIPNGVIRISDGAFQNCLRLTSATIGDGVTSIGDHAFAFCSALTSVTFENTNGWKAGDATLSSAALANTATAAKYLRSTYDHYTWTRS